MTRNNFVTAFALVLFAIGGSRLLVAADSSQSKSPTEGGPPIELFQAMKDGQADVTFIAKSDHEARILIKNNTTKPLHLQMPEAFAGVPVVAQFGGGGGGRGGGGIGGGGRGGGGGGGQQSVGGGGGGGIGGGGGQGGGGGGGFFSVPPEQTAKINVPVVCLDHGLRDPSSSRPYKMVPAEEHLDRPAVVELLKAFGRGDLKQDAVQAAAWHLNNDMSWDQLAAKLAGTKRSPSRPPYFRADAIRAGMAYANEATRRAELNADEYAAKKKAKQEKPAAETKTSDERSTTDENSTESKTADDKTEK
jgi:hypothetical protein